MMKAWQRRQGRVRREDNKGRQKQETSRGASEEARELGRK